MWYDRNLSYNELLGHIRGGYRTGKWGVLDDVDRGMFRASVEYARVKGVIRNPTIVSRLLGIIEKLKATVKTMVLRVGKVKAIEMQNQYSLRGVFKWLPGLKAWLREPAYILWLGIVQTSLQQFYPNTSVGYDS